jgi:hypothetical protein
MTNYGIRAILALPWLPERQLRFLLALETFTSGDGGWREAGTALLAQYAGQSVNTTVKARAELVKSGAVEYRPGSGRGHVGSYRTKVPSYLGYLSSPERYPSAGRKGTQTEPVKVPKQNAVTCENESAVLKEVLSTVLPGAAPGPADGRDRPPGNRGICPVCGETVALLDGRMIGWHPPDAALCPGTGRDAAGMTAP